jgi:hypothetical protein
VGSGRLATAFLLALAVPLAEALSGVTLAQGSTAALALLPWLVLAPVPRATPATESRWEPLRVASCALPVLGLGLGLDLARGASRAPLVLGAASAWVALLLWTTAAEHAAAEPRARQVYARLWFVLVPLPAAVRLALAWVPRGAGADEPGRAAWLALDPWIACHRWGRPGGLSALSGAEAACAVLGGVLAWACAAAGVRAARGARA